MASIVALHPDLEEEDMGDMEMHATQRRKLEMWCWSASIPKDKPSLQHHEAHLLSCKVFRPG